MRLTNHPTRDEILVALKLEGPLRANTIASHLGVTTMAARQHLSALAGDGLIKVSQQRRNVGRPAHVYELSAKGEQLFPRLCSAFSLEILDRLAAADGIDKVDKLLSEHWADHTRKHEARFEHMPLGERVDELVKILDEQGYMAKVEADGPDFHLTQHNCAMRCIAQSYPQMCNHELQCFCALLGTEVERTESVATGDRCCRYVISGAGL